jgi:precorrin-6B methylase 1
MYQELIYDLKNLIYNYIKNNLNIEHQIAVCEELARPDEEVTLTDISKLLLSIEKIYNSTPKNIIKFHET